MFFRHFIFSLAAAFIVTDIWAQDSTAQFDDMLPDQRFEGRLILGTNISCLDGDNYSGYHKAGINAGAMVYVHVSPHTGLSMELCYAQKGMRGANVRESVYVGTYFDRYFVNLNYAEAALMFHLHHIRWLDYSGGLSWGRLINSKEWALADVPVTFPIQYHWFNNYDLCWNIGGSINLSKRWILNLRYQRSAVPVRPWSRVLTRYSNGYQHQYNEVTSIRLMYLL